MSLSKEVRELIEQVKGWSGWRVTETKKGWMVFPPNKELPPIAVHKTPSDHRAIQNIIGRLRRSGGPI